MNIIVVEVFDKDTPVAKALYEFPESDDDNVQYLTDTIDQILELDFSPVSTAILLFGETGARPTAETATFLGEKYHYTRKWIEDLYINRILADHPRSTAQVANYCMVDFDKVLPTTTGSMVSIGVSIDGNVSKVMVSSNEIVTSIVKVK